MPTRDPATALIVRFNNMLDVTVIIPLFSDIIGCSGGFFSQKEDMSAVNTHIQPEGWGP